MVQPSFSAPKKDVSQQASLTSALDIFLDNQHQSYFEELYRSEAVCLCLLRLLPPVCRQIILHALWSHHPLRVTDVKLLLQMDVHAPLEECDEVMRPAIDRKVLHPMHYKKQKMQWSLNDSFKRGLRNALTGLGASNSFGVPFERHQATDLDLPSKDELVAYGEETFESILKYMVSSGLGTEFSGSRPQPEVLQLLHASGLMTDPGDMSRRNPNIYRLTITSKGFQFLLEKRHTQLWEILMYYLSAKEFWPTHLATSLCSGDASAIQSQSADDKRFLILETNYKIYAYTSNELEIAILNLFVDIRIRYPNLVVGKLDRQHVKAAMEKGISARQIIAYLSSHAHPQMYNSPPPLLHPTIVDQLHLWDRERNRLQTEETVMYEFFSKELFDDTVNEAKANAALQHAATSQKLLFIEPHTKPSITEFVKQRQNVLRGGY
ncbi:hypothetical protein I308_106385 [Cryptococcus tetragattii IND107]|uniref:RNA polymerase II transcription factor B subunit 2 n=1 Tax=Cryptococcus tetragattii IND107 TaxID=1296105 RepID=A0ABR3BJD5_9TREE